MIRILRCIPAAFSMYSRIPMPGFKAKDEDTQCIMFLPLIGALIGAIMFALVRILTILPAPVSVRAMIIMIVPLIVTGGFHVDGFMDTVDAKSSHRSMDEKLAILKDPHIGAFSVIRLVTAGIIALCSLVVIINLDSRASRPVYVLACGIFVIARALAALTSIYMKKAKGDGMLVTETMNIRNADIVVLMIQLIAVTALMAYLNPVHTGMIVLAFTVFTLFYRHMTAKEFGGITGDTAGYYVTAGEIFALAVLAVSALYINV